MTAARSTGLDLRDRARITPERVAIDDGGRTWTYARARRALRRARSARSRTADAASSTLTGNSPEHVALFFACAKAGAILHPISWRLAPAELAYQLDDAEPALFLVEDEHDELAEAALALARRAPVSRPAGARTPHRARRRRTTTRCS